MKRLCFHYHMDIAFDAPISNHRFTLKCLPKNGDYQDIYNMKYNVYPNQFVTESSDAFENKSLYGFAPDSHERFYIDVTGFAVVADRQEKQSESKYKVGGYKYHSNITRPGKTLKDYFSAFVFPPSQSNLDKSIVMMKRLHADFAYKKNVTNTNTTAEEAFALGYGVCQDYSHILISLCQMAGIPAKYVVGLLVGEGYSHAWVEVFQLDESGENGYWVAIDPTNNTVVSDCHIKISNGKDSKDCLINQGVFMGLANQKQSVSAIVYEAHNDKIWRKYDRNNSESKLASR